MGAIEMKNVCVGSVLAAIALGANCGAGSVSVSGDLGTNNWGSPPAILASGNSLTVSFVHNFAGRGSIQGDMTADNTGTTFRLKISNLSFHAFDWSSNGYTDVRINASQVFAALPGNYTASHALDGFMESSTLGCIAIGNTILDSGANNSFLTPVTYSSPNGSPQMFSTAPGFGSTLLTHPNILIKMELDLRVFGDGTIILPSSFDSVTVPAPASIFLTGLFFACAKRRRVRV